MHVLMYTSKLKSTTLNDPSNFYCDLAKAIRKHITYLADDETDYDLNDVAYKISSVAKDSRSVKSGIDALSALAMDNKSEMIHLSNLVRSDVLKQNKASSLALEEKMVRMEDRVTRIETEVDKMQSKLDTIINRLSN